MSARALRRLREEENDAILHSNESEEEYESEDDHQAKRSQAFQFMMDDSSDEDSSSSSEDDNDNEDNEDEDDEQDGNDDGKEDVKKTNEDENRDEEEDLDAILSEFQNETNDPNDSTTNNNTNNDILTTTKHSIVLYNNDARDYDIENSLRNMINGTTHSEKSNNSNANSTKRNRRSKTNLFARQRDTWGKKPSSYIGGGLGMQMKWLKDEPSGDVDGDVDGDGDASPSDVPWPYNDESIMPRNIQQWYTFDRSSTYSDRINDYNKFISNTGDINTLAMYIADNPFVVEPMFHFAMFFFSIGENDRGMELLKRILWVMESAAFSSFLHGHENDKTVHLMDREKEENGVFFSALFRLAQTSCMVGCTTTSLAISRFLLSLNPMLDPCGILMVLDYYALATMMQRDVQFLIDLVDADVVKICDKDDIDSGEDSHVCAIREMPNWAFSYALALYRKIHWDADGDDSKEIQRKAEEALDHALARFPFILRMLLEKNGVNLKVRSFQADWPSVIGPLDDMERNTNAGVEKIASIFVERNFKLWSGDDVLKWMYGGCQRLVEKNQEGQVSQEHTPSPALLRYTEFDPMDFQDSFRRIPADASPLDPGLMDAALHYTPNRRRFLRMNRAQGGRGDEGGIDLEMVGRQQPQTLLGTGRNGMDVIDPDLPLLEVFWRSLLPWARVDGVLPPR